MTPARLLRSAGLLAGGLAIAVLATAAAAAADLVVVETKGTRLRAGQVVDGAQVLHLDAGQQVTLVAVDGRTVKLKGPYQAAPMAADPADAPGVVDALRNLVRERSAGTATLATVRSAADQRPLPDAWLIDVGRPGDRCLIENLPAVFWRPDAGQPTQLDVRPADASWQAKANWPASDRLAMPPSLPLRDGETYQVAVGGAAVKLTFHLIPTTASNPAMQAAWMLEKGCEAQAAALLRSAQVQ